MTPGHTSHALDIIYSCMFIWYYTAFYVFCVCLKIYESDLKCKTKIYNYIYMGSI